MAPNISCPSCIPCLTLLFSPSLYSASRSSLPVSNYIFYFPWHPSFLTSSISDLSDYSDNSIPIKGLNADIRM